MKQRPNTWFSALLVVSLSTVNMLFAASQSPLTDVRARFEVAAREACGDRGVKPCTLLSFSSEPLAPSQKPSRTRRLNSMGL